MWILKGYIIHYMLRCADIAVLDTNETITLLSAFSNKQKDMIEVVLENDFNRRFF